MFKIFSVAAVITLIAGTAMAQEISLPAPGGPGATAPLPIPPKTNRPVPPPANSGTPAGPLEPFPGSETTAPTPSQPVENDPIVYTLGHADVTRRVQEYVFYPDAGYNKLEVVGIVGTRGFVYIHSIRLTYRDGRQNEIQPRLNGSYRAGQGNVILMLEPNVSSVVVRASDDGGRRDPQGAFRVDVKATRSIF